MPLPTDCYCHPVPTFQPPELLPEEQLGRLAMVRNPELAPFGVPAERFRIARTGGVSVPSFRRRAPHIGGEGWVPILSRTRARPPFFVFCLHSFTRMPQRVDL